MTLDVSCAFQYADVARAVCRLVQENHVEENHVEEQDFFGPLRMVCEMPQHSCS